MKISTAAKYALAVAGSIVLLAGCSQTGGGGSQQLAPSSGLAFAAKTGSLLPPGVAMSHRSAIGSHRMKPNPCCPQMLFVSDYSANMVQMYNFLNGVYQGALPQPPETFAGPQGECVDSPNPQHVFVANTNASYVDEYTHNGTYVTHLPDTGELPVSCSYRATSPTSGVLAVGNIVATSGAVGGVSVFINTNGSWAGPTVYTLPGGNMERTYFVDYRNNVLFLDGLGFSNSQMFFARMNVGGAFFQIPITGGTINFPGAVQSIASYLAVGDQLPSAGNPNIYHLSTTGAVVGTTTFAPAPADVVQFYRRGPRVVGADAVNVNADRYVYSSGAFIPPAITSPLVQPVGAVVSQQ